MTVVGAINIDLVVPVPSLPRAGATVVGGAMSRHGGGKGANAAVAASRVGAAVRVVGAVGGDDLGRGAIADLRRESVTVDDVATVDVATGVALICVDPGGENQIAVAPGANLALSAAHVRASLEAAADIGCVVVSTEISADAVVAAVETAAGLGVPCVLNPAPVTAEVVGLLRWRPVVTPNAHECADLARALRAAASASGPRSEETTATGETKAGGETGTGGVGSLADDALLIHRASGAPVVVTLGADGVLLVTTEGVAHRMPAVPAAVVVDTTGAGDTFNGVLGVRIAAGDPIEAAVRYAAVAASLSVGGRGARGGMPTREAIDVRLSEVSDPAVS